MRSLSLVGIWWACALTVVPPRFRILFFFFLPTPGLEFLSHIVLGKSQRQTLFPETPRTKGLPGWPGLLIFSSLCVQTWLLSQVGWMGRHPRSLPQAILWPLRR